MIGLCVCVLPSVGQNTRQSEQAGSEVPQWNVSRTEVGNHRDVHRNCDVRTAVTKRKTVPERFGTCWTHLWVHHGGRLQEHIVEVTKYQQQSIPCAAVRAEFSAQAKSTSVQVWISRHRGRLQAVKDATRPWRGARRRITAQSAERENHVRNATWWKACAKSPSGGWPRETTRESRRWARCSQTQSNASQW